MQRDREREREINRGGGGSATVVVVRRGGDAVGDRWERDGRDERGVERDRRD